MNINRNFLDFIELLNKYYVEYMVVGGYAVGLHGHPRYTGDMDIWIMKSKENVEKLLLSIRDFGGPLAHIDKEQLLKNATKHNPAPGISFGREPVRIEVLTTIGGVKFEECFPKAPVKIIAEVPIRYIHYDDLIKNKISTNRTQDKADVEKLEKMRKHKK